MTRIKELREARGIKQEELAMLCNVTQSTVSLWESGKTVPRKSALEVLAARFGVSVGYILGTEDESTVSNVVGVDNKTRDAIWLTDAEKKLIRRFRDLDDDDQEAVLYRALELLKAKEAKGETRTEAG